LKYALYFLISLESLIRFVLAIFKNICTRRFLLFNLSVNRKHKYENISLTFQSTALSVLSTKNISNRFETFSKAILCQSRQQIIFENIQPEKWEHPNQILACNLLPVRPHQFHPSNAQFTILSL